MKKLLVLLLSIVAAFTAVFALTACGNNGDIGSGSSGAIEEGQGGSSGGESGGNQGNTPTHTHAYTQQVTSDKYLKSAATCTEKAKYYFSCACGEKGTQTFTSGGWGKHIYSEKWTYNATEHWHEATCGHTTESGRAKHNFINNVCSVCEYDRTIAVTSVSLNKTTLTLNVDDTETISATVLPTDATNKTVVWSSSDTSVATVNNGVVTAMAKGTATITAKCGNVSATCSVTVNNPYEDFSFTSTGNGYTLTAYSGNQTKVTVPSTYKGKPVTAIGERAFYGCSALTEAVILDSVITIGGYAFKDCSALQAVIIGKSVESLKWQVFENCSKLKTITVPKNVKEIWSGVFSGCAALESVNLECEIEKIEANTFLDCKNLKSVVIPDSVKRIEDYAFSRCYSLEEATIGTNVTYIRGTAFKNCTNLKRVIFKNPTGWELWQEERFKNDVTYPSHWNYSMSDPEKAAKDCVEHSGMSSQGLKWYYYEWRRS